MRKSIIRLVSAILVLIMVAGLAACGGNSAPSENPSAATPSVNDSPKEEPAEAGQEEAAEKISSIHMSTAENTIGFDPFVNDGVSLSFGIYQTLYCYTDDMEMTPDILESWEVAEDGMTATAKLWDDIYTQNGYQVVASDIIWSISMAQKGVQAKFASIFDVDNCSVVDDTTAVIAFKERWNDFNYDTLCHIPVTSEEAYNASEDHFYYNSDGATGPYKVINFEEGLGYTLVKSETYTHGYHKQNVDQIVFDVIPEASQKLIAFESGDLDMMASPNLNDIDYINSMEEAVIFDLMGIQNDGLFFNLGQAGPLQDPLVREAICYAINNEEIVESVFSNWRTAGVSVIGPNDREYSDEVVKAAADTYYAFNPEKAKELLKEAGYENGFDLVLVYSSKVGTNESVCQILQGYLANVGINVTLQAYDGTTFDTVTKGTEGWDIYVAQFKNWISVLFPFYDIFNANKSQRCGWFDQDFQDMLDEAVYSMDEATIADMVELYEDAIVTYTMDYTTRQFLYRKGITDFAICADSKIFPGDWTYGEAGDWLYD